VNALRLAFGLLTAVPVGRLPQVDRRSAARAVLLAPVTTAPLLVVLLGAHAAVAAGAPALVLAAVVLAAGALLSRAMHLDGLADTADGLSAGYDAASSLRAMKASDTGPSGVAAVVLALLLQATSLAAVLPSAWGTALAVVAWLASRHAVAWACRRGLPAAQDTGLGALVAGGVGRPALALAAALVTGCAVAAGTVASLAANGPAAGDGSPPGATVAAAGAVAVLVVALAAAHLLVRRCRHRLGGITGDVLGAGIEVALSTGLVTAALLVSI
jgi:adenosylcobinamide-GDP ribazoletransferase